MVQNNNYKMSTSQHTVTTQVNTGLKKRSKRVMGNNVLPWWLSENLHFPMNVHYV